ncbi:MAG: hypothetical protein IAE77_07545 [Prosthecobacter sp.]|jgi:hypothetical protein|uniref:hypothetical protein n=1 Tax=Prosthecobacter sp. TaxID=1965333 RepID=UPI001A0CFF50|nr:hypothetical protein [Prosthecobacter sp.]MBE2283300.1 hypothetical protein [Prosthecobacter sp.]
MDVIEADQLLQRPLESKDFNRLAKWLREISDSIRLDFFRRHLHLSHPAFWRLATSCINSRAEAFDLFKRGLDDIVSAHSQKTKICTQFGVAKLGAKRAIAVIAARIDSQPHVVDMALYWLPCMISKDAPTFALLKALQAEAERTNIIKPTRRIEGVGGSVTYADRYGAE